MFEVYDLCWEAFALFLCLVSFSQRVSTLIKSKTVLMADRK